MVRYYDSRPQPPQRTRGLSRIRPWGRVDYSMISSQQFGRADIRLLVFPPGITPQERAWAGVWCWLFYRELWAVVAVPIGIAAISIPGLTVTTRLLIVAGVYLAALGVLWLKARKTLAESRGVLVRAQRGRRAGDPASVSGDLALFESIVARLDELDADSELTPAQYENRWAGIYEQLGSLVPIEHPERRP